MSDRLKIYFAGSIHGGQNDVGIYARIIEHLNKHGDVLTEHVGDSNVIEKENPEERSKEIHDRDLEWLTSADVLIAEVTQPSLGVGYEIGRAVAMNKPILCLFRPSSGKTLSCMIRGAHNGDSFIVEEYDDSGFVKIVDQYIAKLKKTEEAKETE